MSGISHGFQVGFDYRHGRLKSASKNLSCAMEYKEVINVYLTNELCQQRISGAFNKSEVEKIHFSRFGVIPKGHGYVYGLVCGLLNSICTVTYFDFSNLFVPLLSNAICTVLYFCSMAWPNFKGCL